MGEFTVGPRAPRPRPRAHIETVPVVGIAANAKDAFVLRADGAIFAIPVGASARAAQVRRIATIATRLPGERKTPRAKK